MAMNNWKSKIAVFVLLITFSVGSLAQDNAKLLFSVQVSFASLSHVKDRHFVLKAKLNKIESVLAFSDRPVRFAHKLNKSDYGLYMQKAEYHPDNLPNIVLSFRDRAKQAMPFEVRSYKVTKDEIVCQLVSLGGMSSFKQLKAYDGPMDIYVDD